MVLLLLEVENPKVFYINIQAIGGIIYKIFSKLLLKARIDDPLDAFPVHGGCGVWGLIAGGLFSTKLFVREVYGRDASVDDWGVS